MFTMYEGVPAALELARDRAVGHDAVRLVEQLEVVRVAVRLQQVLLRVRVRVRVTVTVTVTVTVRPAAAAPAHAPPSG